MCAINGFNWQDKELGLRMNSATAHRGPDGTAVFFDDGVTFGHNRLAIIDPDPRADQPMKNANGNLIITYNGELYNFKDIKAQLPDYPFRTQSDTEVILAAYEKWGPKMLERFNGIFAFAIWDKEKAELFIARDQMGIKPFYYYLENNKFIFSSEIKGILEHGVSRVLDLEAFNHYMRLLYVPGPYTLFKNIHKFPQAHYGVVKNGKLTLARYWNLGTRPLGESEKKEPEELRKLLGKAVERQLVSDKPLGVYLSGGIDSSAVLAAMSSVRSNIDTFSVGFELEKSQQSEKFNADLELASKTARHFGTRHHEVLVSPEELNITLEQSLWNLDEPIGNATVIPQLILSRFTKAHVDVALTGDGGDELFGGYPRYKYSRLLDYSPIKYPVEKRLERFMFQKNDVLSKVIMPNYFNETVTRKFFEDNPDKFEGNLTEALMRLDRQSWLADEALVRTDKLNMAHGVEARVPFLDRQIVEYAATIPISQKVSLFNTKIILKEAFKNDLPEFIFNQPKRGFFSPGAKWLRYPEFTAFARSVCSPGYYAPTSTLFDFKNLEEIIDKHVNFSQYNLNLIWAVLSFQIWAKRYSISL